MGATETATNSPPGAHPVSEVYQRDLRQRVATLLDLNPGQATRFPGAQPISLVRRNLEDFERQDWFVSEKSDGTRYLMFITLTPVPNRGMTQEVFLVDRKWEFHFVQLVFPRDPMMRQPLGDTILDGELVLDRMDDGSTQARFLAFDLLLFDGRIMTERDFSKRLGYLKECVIKPYNESFKRRTVEERAAVPFTVELKMLERCYAMDRVVDVIAKLKHGNDGLIFTAANAPYTLGTCSTMIKWKPPEMNSADFQIEERKDSETGRLRWFLFVQESKNRLMEYGELVPENEEIMKDWMSKSPHGRIVECSYDPEYPTKWKFMRFRDDKSTPNFISVMDRIMESIKEGVSLDVLTEKERLERIRSKWVEREKQAKTGNGPVVPPQKPPPQTDAHKKRPRENFEDDSETYRPPPSARQPS